MNFRVAEHFYSIQGEGATMGVPAVFLRLAGCNLLCGGHGTIEDNKLHDGATWRCDTIEVWMQGQKTSIENLVSLFASAGYMNQLRDGAHLVITGGEPLMQQDCIIEFLRALPSRTYVEIETNGTLRPSPELYPLVNQFNISLKLANSGMPLGRRCKADAIADFRATTRDTWFKFVVSSVEDIQEVADLVEKFNLPQRKIILMPACSTQSVLRKLLPMIADACKEKTWRLSSRLQLELWDQTTGV